MNIMLKKSMHSTLLGLAKRYSDDAEESRAAAKRLRDQSFNHDSMADHLNVMAKQFEEMAALHPADSVEQDDVVDAEFIPQEEGKPS